MQRVIGEYSLDDLFGIEFTGARVLQHFSNGFERQGTVKHAEVTATAFIMYVEFGSGSTERVELPQVGNDSWFAQIQDSEYIIVEHVRYALNPLTRARMKLSGPQVIRYEFFLKV